MSGAASGSGASVATVGSVVALGCLWMLSLADFLCFLPVRPRPRLRGISVHAAAARRGRLLDGDLQQEGAHVWSVVADALGLARGRGVYREAGLPNTFGAHLPRRAARKNFIRRLSHFPHTTTSRTRWTFHSDKNRHTADGTGRVAVD